MSASRISAAVAAIAPSATLAVDAKAKALKAAGEPVIGFGAGEPDFPTPAHIVEAAVEACRDPKNHKYTPAGGLPELKQAIAAKTKRDSGLDVDPANVLVTNGGKHAVYAAFLTLVDPGDEVLLPAPYWTTYPEPVGLAGGVTVPVVCDETTGFKATVEQLEAARTDKTKVLVFVSPSNPTGAVYSRTRSGPSASGRPSTASGSSPTRSTSTSSTATTSSRSMPVEVPEIADRCVVLNGVAKTYAMTGWRVGWMIGPNDVIKGATNLQSHSTSNVANVSQRAALAAVSGPLDDVAMMREAFDRRRQTIWKMLDAIDGVELPRARGGVLRLPQPHRALRPLAERPHADNTLDLAAIILEEAKVAIVPGEAFGTPGYARLSFALGDDDLARACSASPTWLPGREPAGRPVRRVALADHP